MTAGSKMSPEIDMGEAKDSIFKMSSFLYVSYLIVISLPDQPPSPIQIS
jgi:hypothetical protein